MSDVVRVIPSRGTGQAVLIGVRQGLILAEIQTYIYIYIYKKTEVDRYIRIYIYRHTYMYIYLFWMIPCDFVWRISPQCSTMKILILCQCASSFNVVAM